MGLKRRGRELDDLFKNLPQMLVDVCRRSDTHTDWCLFLLGRGRKPGVGLPPDLVDVVKYLLEQGVITKTQLSELGPEIEDLIIKELKDVSKKVKEAMVQAVASKRPEVLEGSLKELIEKSDKLVGIGKAVLSEEPKEIIKDVMKAELTPNVAEKISMFVGKGFTDRDIKSLVKEVMEAEVKPGEELISKVGRIEESREVPPVVRPRAELREVK